MSQPAATETDDRSLHPLAQLPGFALRRAANAMMAELATALAPLDLKISDTALLMLVQGRRDMTSSRIGELLDIQRANMVPLLARLESAGLIERVPIDRRSSAIVLTAQGQAQHDAALAIITRFEHDLLARIAPEHRDHFLPALTNLVS